MKFALKICAGLSWAAICQSAVYTEDPSQQQIMWKKFKEDFNRVYASEEDEKMRFEVFLTTLKLIDERNRKETGTAVHGARCILN